MKPRGMETLESEGAGRALAGETPAVENVIHIDTRWWTEKPVERGSIEWVFFRVKSF
jgi:hypothetical protein